MNNIQKSFKDKGLRAGGKYAGGFIPVGLGSGKGVDPQSKGIGGNLQRTINERTRRMNEAIDGEEIQPDTSLRQAPVVSAPAPASSKSYEQLDADIAAARAKMKKPKNFLGFRDGKVPDLAGIGAVIPGKDPKQKDNVPVKVSAEEGIIPRKSMKALESILAEATGESVAQFIHRTNGKPPAGLGIGKKYAGGMVDEEKRKPGAMPEFEVPGVFNPSTYGGMTPAAIRPSISPEKALAMAQSRMTIKSATGIGGGVDPATRLAQPHNAQPQSTTAPVAYSSGPYYSGNVERDTAKFNDDAGRRVNERNAAINSNKQTNAGIAADWKNTAVGQSINEYRQGNPGASQQAINSPASGSYNPENVRIQRDQDAYWGNRKQAADAKYALDNYTNLSAADKAGYNAQIQASNAGIAGMRADDTTRRAQDQQRGGIQDKIAGDAPLNAAHAGVYGQQGGLYGAQTQAAQQAMQQSAKLEKWNNDFFSKIGEATPEDRAILMEGYMLRNKISPQKQQEGYTDIEENMPDGGVKKTRTYGNQQSGGNQQKAEAIAWAKANPNDPRAKEVLARVGV